MQRELIRMSESQTKNKLVTCFDIQGIVHFEFISQGQTVNYAYYVKILKRLRWDVRRKRHELWPNDSIPYHDNVPAHKTLSIKHFMNQRSITVI